MSKATIETAAAFAKDMEDLRRDLALARNELANVRMLAMRMRKTDPDNAAHLLRFCERAGVIGSVTR